MTIVQPEDAVTPQKVQMEEQVSPQQKNAELQRAPATQNAELQRAPATQNRLPKTLMVAYLFCLTILEQSVKKYQLPTNYFFGNES